MTTSLFFQSTDEIGNAMGINHQLLKLVEFSSLEAPENVRSLVPHARIFGIADDHERTQLFERTSVDVLRRIKADIESLDSLLDDWLAGDEAHSDDPTNAYVAFSAMRMGMDAVY